MSEREERIDFLICRAEAVLIDMKFKITEKDWHGVQDAASDLRDIDSEMKGLRLIE